ncbi:SAVMC3_10250 family protein [Streptomyces sp. NPDC006290]|uniref:SAVMC3_10250 family protein n=1 Tax=Streptomyces sp. NPDC006290 TaxID=3156745 RepID=UPI0033B9F5E8
MREIVYLSDSKLRQFVPEPRRAPRLGALRLTTPLGGIDMDTPTADSEQGQLRHLREVNKHVALLADWYTEPRLRPGQWVQFEAPLRCVTFSDTHQDLVLFVEPAREGGTDGRCRLLMHGSVQHLRGWNAMPVEGLAPDAMNSASSLGSAFIARAGQVVDALIRHRDTMATDQISRPTAARLHGQDVQELLHALDDADDSIDTSAVMTGYARVTGLIPRTYATSRCVVASPLVVEYTVGDLEVADN